jgi:hypothetical protein
MPADGTELTDVELVRKQWVVVGTILFGENRDDFQDLPIVRNGNDVQLSHLVMARAVRDPKDNRRVGVDKDGNLVIRLFTVGYKANYRAFKRACYRLPASGIQLTEVLIHNWELITTNGHLMMSQIYRRTYARLYGRVQTPVQAPAPALSSQVIDLSADDDENAAGAA